MLVNVKALLKRSKILNIIKSSRYKINFTSKKRLVKRFSRSATTTSYNKSARAFSAYRDYSKKKTY